VTHVPLEADYVREMVEWADETAAFSFRRLSLVLAGHYCGGQWRLGSLGPVYVPERAVVGDTGIVGMERINSITSYVSPAGAQRLLPLPGKAVQYAGGHAAGLYGGDFITKEQNKSRGAAAPAAEKTPIRCSCRGAAKEYPKRTGKPSPSVFSVAPLHGRPRRPAKRPNGSLTGRFAGCACRARARCGWPPAAFALRAFRAFRAGRRGICEAGSLPPARFRSRLTFAARKDTIN
jgi:hypothetical protein